MFGINWRWHAIVRIGLSLIGAILIFGTLGCSDRTEAPLGLSGGSSEISQSANISEVSPPEVLQQLRQTLEVYQPQVKILSPQLNDVLTDTAVSVRLQVQDLPTFKDAKLGLGPHLHVILDNQPYKAVYDTNEPLIFEDLAPGTHTIRAFASRPWHESFKNEGAYAQTTFHIFARTQDNDPEAKKPLLTYSRPVGTYGAEPILLDFYLTNAPLHLIAQEKPDDEILDWKIRATVNGESFIIDQWQPLYLKGFKSGKNWVQLELLDELGNPVDNEFNNTVRLITYEPKGKDTLAKLTRGELSATEARSIVEQNYTSPSSPAIPTPVPTPEVFPTLPEIIESPEAEITPEPTKSEGPFSRFRRQPEETPTPVPTEAPNVPEVIQSPVSPEAAPEVEMAPEPETAEPTGFFNRFRRSKPIEPAPSVSPALPEVVETPIPEPEVLPAVPEIVEPEIQPTQTPEPTVKTSKPEGLLNRFRQKRDRLFPAPSAAPTLPEIIETPNPEPAPVPSLEAPPAVEEAPVIPFPTPTLEETPQSSTTPFLEPSGTPLPIIQPTASPNIPSRYLQPSPETSSAPELESQEAISP